METFTEEGALLVDTYGLRLLSYVTSVAEDELRRRLSGAGTLEGRVEAVLSPLILVAQQAASAAAIRGSPIRFHLDVLGQFQPSLGTSLATALRLQAGGDVPLSIPEDGLARHLALMLRDVFPLMLLPDDPWFPGHITLTSAVFRHPEREPFEAAVAGDLDLSRLFPPTPSTRTGPLPLVYRSTGYGGPTQLELLPDLLLGGAWARARAKNHDDIASVGQELTAVVDIVRRAARGEPCDVPVLVAFTGLLAEGIEALQLPYGTLRPIAQHERALAPPSIEGTLSHTIGEGDTVVISYAGDLVLDTTVPYRLRLVETANVDAALPWPPQLRGFDEVEANIDTTRLAALLAGTTDAPLTLVPTWRMTLDPLNFGPMLGWNDPRTLPGLAPRRLSGTVAAEFADLAKGISAQRRPDFDVAVRRTISGMTTRGDPSDALVDLVIGWENLFGSSQGELRFRISAAIAWVLGSDAHERTELQELTSRIYDRRSEILHGSAPTPEQVQESLTIARGITIRLLRALFTDRKAVLSLTTGTARSKAVILGQ